MTRPTDLLPRFLSCPIQHLIIVCSVFAAFSPGLWAEGSLVDDIGLLNILRNSHNLDPVQFFRFDSSFYYRPLNDLFFWFDHIAWGANPVAMHAENILLHLLNSLLVFWLLRLLTRGDSRTVNLFPLLGALLFGLHPITTESVNWIAGRTDILAATGLLGATLCVTAWSKRGRPWLLLAALLLLVCSLLTKEAAWGFLLASPFLWYALTKNRSDAAYNQGNLSSHHLLAIGFCLSIAFLTASLFLTFWPPLALAVASWGIWRHQLADPFKRSWKKTAIELAIAAALLAVILFVGLYLCKAIALTKPFSPLKQTLLAMVIAPDKALQLTSMAAAFYMKKFFLPLPLSFSIITIAPQYIFGGILILFLTAALCAIRHTFTALFLCGICTLIPALPLLYGTLAWTPYAERYIYIPSAFWTAALVYALSQLQKPALRNSALVLLTLLVPMAATVSSLRSKTWQRNLTLFEDTVRKSPDHLESRGLYVSSLGLDGQFDKAREQYEEIRKRTKKPLRMKFDYSYALLLHNADLHDEALAILEQSLTEWRMFSSPDSFYYPEWKRMYDAYLKLTQKLARHPIRYDN